MPGSLNNSYAVTLLVFHIKGKPLTSPSFTGRNQNRVLFDICATDFHRVDTRHLYTKSDWEIWTAAVADDKTIRMIIASMWKSLEEASSNRGFSDLCRSSIRWLCGWVDSRNITP